MVFVVSQDASAAESMLLVVATADGQFQFPGSVVTEFKQNSRRWYSQRWWAGQSEAAKVDGHRGR